MIRLFRPSMSWPELRQESWGFAALGLSLLAAFAIAFGGWAFGAPVAFTRTGVAAILALMIVRCLFVREEAKSPRVRAVMEAAGAVQAVLAALCLAGFGPWPVWSTPPSVFLSVLLIVWGGFLTADGIVQGARLIYRQPAFHLFAKPFLVRLGWVVGGVILLTLGFCAPAAAASCADRESAVANLRDRFGEAPVWRGLTQGGNMEELWTNATTGTWTYLGTTPDGKSCIVSSGTPGELIAPAPAGEAS